MKQKLTWILSTLIALGTICAMATPYNPITISKKLKYVELRLDQKILNDNINAWQNRIWLLQDRYRGQQMPQSVIEEIRRLQKQIKDAEFQLRRKG